MKRRMKRREFFAPLCGCVAVRGACAAAGDSGDRVPQQPITR